MCVFVCLFGVVFFLKKMLRLKKKLDLDDFVREKNVFIDKMCSSGEVNRWLIIEEIIPDNSRLLEAIFGFFWGSIVG